MHATGQHTFAQLSPAAVWEGLLNPALLVQALPRCRQLESVLYHERYTAVVRSHVGPIDERDYRIEINFGEKELHARYTFEFKVKDTVSQQVQMEGTGNIRLEASGEDTLLHYDIQGEAFGNYAGVGLLLLETMVRGMMREFCDRLAPLLRGEPLPQLTLAPRAARLQASLSDMQRLWLIGGLLSAVALVAALLYWRQRPRSTERW